MSWQTDYNKWYNDIFLPWWKTNVHTASDAKWGHQYAADMQAVFQQKILDKKNSDAQKKAQRDSNIVLAGAAVGLPFLQSLSERSAEWFGKNGFSGILKEIKGLGDLSIGDTVSEGVNTAKGFLGLGEEKVASNVSADAPYGNILDPQGNPIGTEGPPTEGGFFDMTAPENGSFGQIASGIAALKGGYDTFQGLQHGKSGRAGLTELGGGVGGLFGGAPGAAIGSAMGNLAGYGLQGEGWKNHAALLANPLTWPLEAARLAGFNPIHKTMAQYHQQRTEQLLDRGFTQEQLDTLRSPTTKEQNEEWFRLQKEGKAPSQEQMGKDPLSLWGSDGMLKTFGPDYLNKMSEQDRYALTKYAIDQGYLQNDKGDWVISGQDQEKLRAAAEEAKKDPANLAGYNEWNQGGRSNDWYTRQQSQVPTSSATPPQGNSPMGNPVTGDVGAPTPTPTGPEITGAPEGLTPEDINKAGAKSLDDPQSGLIGLGQQVGPQAEVQKARQLIQSNPAARAQVVAQLKAKGIPDYLFTDLNVPASVVSSPVAKSSSAGLIGLGQRRY